MWKIVRASKASVLYIFSFRKKKKNNNVLMWKIVRASKASVLYIYILIILYVSVFKGGIFANVSTPG